MVAPNGKIANTQFISLESLSNSTNNLSAGFNTMALNEDTRGRSRATTVVHLTRHPNPSRQWTMLKE